MRSSAYAANDLSRVRGAFMGCAMFDALGMPVETFSAEKIRSKFGRVTGFLEPVGHKWFDGMQAGETTDDTQLWLATADAVAESKTFDMDAIARNHVAAFNEGTKGWGRSTRESIRRIVNGAHWSKSATGSGLGNGVVMKIGPLALYFHLKKMNWYANATSVADFSLMTHRTCLASTCSGGHVAALMYCLRCSEEKPFEKEKFLKDVLLGMKIGAAFSEGEPGEGENDVASLIPTLQDEYTTEEIIEKFKGSSHVGESLPFTYAFFLKGNESFEDGLEVINSGGDTDSNGAIWGALFGSMRGIEAFPQALVAEFPESNRVLAAADRFYNSLCG